MAKIVWFPAGNVPSVPVFAPKLLFNGLYYGSAKAATVQ